MLLVLEEAVHLDDVGVVQEGLDLYLPLDLDLERLLAVAVGQEHPFYCAHEVRILVPMARYK